MMFYNFMLFFYVDNNKTYYKKIIKHTTTCKIQSKSK
ncbi:Hypothetical Protein SLY_0915 [Strawberry lethal yellows phytoplasma (CPA) str. NZSb11]|uniref:Uncharacterized protein n=1 Tax=Strawberry lethal yellows phytoplasma (CPA) str. NZSb11 TaxID=980422 RepID=R4RN87_PHYAS|nr:Hypothetical Protein SLY_0915 [Strawberry lethal yellows phytoplasma (CPA) str. NZSb11]